MSQIHNRLAKKVENLVRRQNKSNNDTICAVRRRKGINMVSLGRTR